MVPIVYAYGPNKICIWSQSNMHLVPIKYAFGPNCICIWSQLYIHIVPMKVANYFYCIQSLSQETQAVIVGLIKGGLHTIKSSTMARPSGKI